MNKLVYGVGVNDLDYRTQINEYVTKDGGERVLKSPKTDVFWDIPFLPSNQGVSKEKVAIGDSTTQKSEKWTKGGRVSDRTDTPRGR